MLPLMACQCFATEKHNDNASMTKSEKQLHGFLAMARTYVIGGELFPTNHHPFSQTSAQERLNEGG